jgi:TatD DNase family protein
VTQTLADTHAHLYFDDYENDLSEVLERAWETGLNRILLPAVDIETSHQVIELSEKHTQIFCAIGVHPNSAQGWKGSEVEILARLAKHPKVKAIGEIGMDYYRNHTPKETQHLAFTAQLDLAASLELPVVIHNRNSWTDLWPIVRHWHESLIKNESALLNRPGVFHSYSQGVEYSEEMIAHHFFFGIGGPVTFLNAKNLQKEIKDLPLDHLLLETDAPFLSPHPFRGERNEPKNVRIIAQKIAELKDISYKIVAESTTNNANQLFNWSNQA